MNLTGILARLDDHGGQGVFSFEEGSVVRRGFAVVRRDVEAAIERLRGYGVTPGMRVGIRAGNSYPWIVHDLALLELRAVSVAFTEDFSAAPAAELQRRYGLGLLLVSSKDSPPESEGSAVAFIDPDGLRRQPPGSVRADDSCAREPDPDFECPSLVFSSGTSGRVKGLRVSRRGAEATIEAFTSRFQPTADDRLLMFLPISNYQQRMMCYAAMGFGFDLILADPQHLFRALRELRPTLFVAPPLFYEAIEGKLLAATGWRKRAVERGGALLERIPVPALRDRAARALYAEVHASLGGRMRFMLTGMAPIKRSTLQLFERMRLPLFETYGLTECGPVALNVPGQNRLGSVGRPVEPGSVEIAPDGEILVRKRHPQSSGYFDVPPEEQAATFLGDGRVATGDVGRFDEDGYLYLLGRKKEILVTPGGVKVHPEVLEGEIDACPDVAKSVVLGGAGLPTLVAVVSARGPLDPGVEDRIRRHIDLLNTKHPPAIRVGRVVCTDTPFTRENGLLRPNLKLDRARIQERFAPPEQGPRRDGARTPFVAPRTPTERTLAGLWEGQLGVRPVGVEDDFFALGGSSLLALRLAAEVKERLGVALPMATLFRFPTIAALAAALDGASPDRPSPDSTSPHGASPDKLSSDSLSSNSPSPGSSSPDSASPDKLSPNTHSPDTLSPDTHSPDTHSPDGLPWLSPGAALRPAPRPHGEPAYGGLSGTERRLWFEERLLRGARAYQVPQAFRVAGPLDEAALRTAVDALARRHEILRTTYPEVDGAPARRVAPEPAVPVRLADLSALPAAEREPAALRAAAEEASTAFDLERGPLTRVLLIRLAPDEHVVLVHQHHVVTDEWSSGVLWRELIAFHGMATRGLPPALPPLPYQYADYARAEQEALEAIEPFAASRAYWKQQLAGVPRLSLPIARPAAGGPGPEGEVTVRVDPETVRALESLARESGATSFMAWYAALAAVLARHGGQTDFGVGSVVANRDVPGTEKLLGFLTNTVVLRTDLSGDPAFREILRRARRTAVDAYRHQALPFDVVVQDAAAPDPGDLRHAGRDPLYEVSFVEVTAPTLDGAPGWTPVQATLPQGVFGAKTALGVEVRRSASGTEVAARFDAARLDRAAVERLLSHLLVLARDAAAHPDRRLSGLSLLSAADLALLSAWNATDAPYPADRCVHELFEAQARRTPGAVAVEMGGEQWSYSKLDAEANRLARHLRALGVGPEVRAGICVERSIAMVVALLAILKAGGAYVPLDPGYPAERLGFLLADARVPVLLTAAHLEGRLPAHGARVVRLDADAADWAGQPAGPLGRTAGPENLIYVIHTSGSTGVPKGIAMPHRALSKMLAWQVDSLSLPASVTTLQFASLSFDVSFQEILSTLISGGRLRLMTEAERLDPAHVLSLLLSGQVERAFLPPVMLQHVAGALRAAHGAQGERGARCEVIAAGEQLVITPAILELFGAFREAWLHNHYGPTETHAASAFAAPGAGVGLGPASIGRPIPNTQVHLLDAHLARVPIGVPGEVLIAGEGLARGYLDRPGLTAERFLPDPFSAVPGARMYRTGDLARWDDRGELEFLGRVDHQIKIRGFRVELGEIEGLLLRHPAVREAVVTAREDGPGDRRLVAYLVAREPAAAPPARDVRDHLRRTLPDYMVPSALVWLDALPLSPNGKVDRKALPAPEGARGDTADSFVAPRTPAEEALAAIWERVLGVRPIGVEDSFFALGGYSLLAVRLLAEVKAKLGAAPSMATFFEGPTIAELAGALAGEAAVGAPEAALHPAGRAPGETAYGGLSSTERRLWFLETLRPEARAYQVPQAFRVTGPLDEAALRTAVDQLARRHEILRTTYPEIDGAPARRVAPEPAVPVRLADLSALPPAEREPAALRAAAEEVAAPFDLERGPLTRVLLLRLAPEEHVVLVHQHHVVTDEWSAGVLWRELIEFHEKAINGLTPALPPLPYQYADYARAEQEALDAGEPFAAARAYWKQQLAGVPRLSLPIARPAAGGPGPEGEVTVCIAPETSRALAALARESGATSFMAWYAAFAAVLARHGGQTDFGLGAVVANRNAAGADGLLGFFANTVVLRTDLSGDPTFPEILRRARRTALDAYRHQALPFDVVVQDQGARRGAGENPLYDVSFIEVTVPEEGLSPGWAPVVDRPLTEGATSAKEALGVAVQHRREGTFVRASFDARRVPRAAAERLLGHLERLLADALAHPDRRLSELALLTGEEAAALAAWNDTAAPYPSEHCIHQLFEEQARRTPGAVAVEIGDERWSYSKLDAEANRLAHHLRALGVGPETRVGLCAERSAEMVVGLLGILKAGGAYVPLDPAYPAARLGFMLADARAPVLLAQARTAERLPAHGARVVRLDGQGGEEVEWAACPATPPEGGARPDNAMYVIYTSGSTGQPKGAVNTHRALANRLHWMQRVYGLDDGDAVLQKTPLSFDVSGWEVWWPLLAGARMVLAPPGAQVDPEQIAAIIEARGVTTLHFVPSMLAAFLSAPVAPASWPLRRVFCSGEELPRHLVKAWYERGGAPLHNLYGPTEAAIDVTSHACRPDAEGPVPIGRPVDNTAVYILDRDLSPAPVGAAGELYLSGVQLARGYLDRPALTAERFVPDPLSAAPGARMYRTGDLARWNEQGELEFLGRIDHQVKVRGFRVELGEIEAALCAHPAVREAVAAVARRGAEDAALVGYVVPRDGEAATPEALREHLRARLPGHMVPSFLVTLERLPLGPSGKVDRGALPPPRPEGREGPAAPPRDEMEALVARVLGEVLGLARVGVHDHFFDDLGGTSLAMVRAAAALSRELGVKVPVVRLFEHPTAAALAAGLRGPAAATELRTTAERARGRRDAILRARRGDGQKRGNGDG